MRKFARALEKKAKKLVFSMLRQTSSAKGPTPLSDLKHARRIIVIRPNYRMGNAILSTAIIGPLQERFPEATIDVLATDKTSALFQNLGINQIFSLKRKNFAQPWELLHLLRQLRAKHYDLAINLANNSLSGLLLSKAVRAKLLMGQSKESESWYDIRVSQPTSHAYDTCKAFARTLEAHSPANPQLAISLEESRLAINKLQELGMATTPTGPIEPFTAIFVGGHSGKTCPSWFWLELTEKMASSGIRFVVFVGPEETSLLPLLQNALNSMPFGTICPPQPLRVFGAMLAKARYLVTPDSGPMHMAAALKIPVIMLARQETSTQFVPPGLENHVVGQLDVTRILSLLDTAQHNLSPAPSQTQDGIGQTESLSGILEHAAQLAAGR